MKSIPRRVRRGKKPARDVAPITPTIPSPAPVPRLEIPPMAPEQAPRRPAVPPKVSLREIIENALGDIDGARESVEELMWNAADATSEEPDMEPTSLHVSSYEHASNAFHSLRSVTRRLRDVVHQLSQRGVL